MTSVAGDVSLPLLLTASEAIGHPCLKLMILPNRAKTQSFLGPDEAQCWWPMNISHSLFLQLSQTGLFSEDCGDARR